MESQESLFSQDDQQVIDVRGGMTFPRVEGRFWIAVVGKEVTLGYLEALVVSPWICVLSYRRGRRHRGWIIVC